jgi:LPS sulfotransferase NodH
MLLLGDAKVIMLRRRNALQRAISERISQQMGVWTIYTEQDRRHIRQHQFGPLDIEMLRQDIAVVQAEEKRLYELIAASGKAWRDVSYEDFFSAAASMDSGMAVLQSLWKFLGVEALVDPARLEMVRQLFDPALTGFGNAGAYERVPNIQEVEKALGHDATGHVFGGP